MFSHRPFLIAGPCGAETEEQMLAIAKALKHEKVNMIRAGIWKPRTKPGHFEGGGETALKWLHEVKNISGKKVCIEVATKEQVELALKYNIDCVWIGARSTVSPFIVQEIAEAVKGTTLGIMIKNPVNPDVELWSGAVERVLNGHIKNLAIIHRGFSSYDPSSIYRNKPNWAIPIEMRRRYPSIPIYCDISHISGRKDILVNVAQKAADLNFDGWMIETHPKPVEALSDAQQQITPGELYALLEKIIIREPISDNIVQEKISAIRQVMDSLDAEIVDLISKRRTLAAELGIIKRENNHPIYQDERWREIVESRCHWGEIKEMDPKFILKIFEFIHEDSIKLQMVSKKEKS